MTFISLYDRTGNMARPWAEAGYNCWCVDMRHSIRRPRIERVGAGVIHFVWGDIRSWAPPAEAFPISFVSVCSPCTHLAVSGARDFVTKGLPLLCDALDLFAAGIQCAQWSGAPYCAENPVGVISTHFRQPNHRFDPFDYAGYLDDPSTEAYTKRTCLWTGGGFVMPEPKPVKPTLGSLMHLMTPDDDREDLRSATPMGFARAVFAANSPLPTSPAAGMVEIEGGQQ